MFNRHGATFASTTQTRFFLGFKYTKNALAAAAASQRPLEKLTVIPRLLAGFEDRLVATGNEVQREDMKGRDGKRE